MDDGGGVYESDPSGSTARFTWTNVGFAEVSHHCKSRQPLHSTASLHNIRKNSPVRNQTKLVINQNDPAINGYLKFLSAFDLELLEFNHK